MPAYSANPSNTYRQQSVLTATPGPARRVMLYDGALRFLMQASTALRAWVHAA